MSTLPVLLSFMDGFDGIQNKVYDDFLGFYPHRPQKQYHQPLHLSLANGCNGIISQRQQNGVQQQDQGETSIIGKDGLQVCMDVQQFKPSEISVKTVDNCIVVEGKHEERPDEHGFISRQFLRRYTLPKGYEPSQVISTLSSDGVLTVRAPPPPNADKQNERIIEIQHTGPAHLTVKDNPREDKPEEQKPEKTE